MPEVSPHALRRAWEDVLRQAGVAADVRRALCGWRSTGAQGIYTTVRDDERTAAVAAVVLRVRG